MKYVDKVLQPGEQVLYRARVHWVVFLPSILLIALAVAIAVVLSVLLPARSPELFWAYAASAGIAVLGIFMALPAWIRRISTELAITDRRVIVKFGVIRRTTMEMNRSKIESVLVEQGFWARVLDYGTIIVKGTGGGFEPVIGIAHPLAFRNTITAA